MNSFTIKTLTGPVTFTVSDTGDKIEKISGWRLQVAQGEVSEATGTYLGRQDTEIIAWDEFTKPLYVISINNGCSVMTRYYLFANEEDMNAALEIIRPLRHEQAFDVGPMRDARSPIEGERYDIKASHDILFDRTTIGHSSPIPMYLTDDDRAFSIIFCTAQPEGVINLRSRWSRSAFPLSGSGKFTTGPYSPDIRAPEKVSEAARSVASSSGTPNTNNKLPLLTPVE